MDETPIKSSRLNKTFKVISIIPLIIYYNPFGKFNVSIRTPKWKKNNLSFSITLYIFDIFNSLFVEDI